VLNLSQCVCWLIGPDASHVMTCMVATQSDALAQPRIAKLACAACTPPWLMDC
jgi:hypothetical protein